MSQLDHDHGGGVAGPRGRPAAPPSVASLRSSWQSPSREEDFSLPVLQNFVGTVQSVWGPTGVQNWHVPPSSWPTPFGLLYRLDSQPGLDPDAKSQVRSSRVESSGTDYQISAAVLNRRHPVVSAETWLSPPEPLAAEPAGPTRADAVLTERLTFHQPGRYAIVFGGLCRVWGFGSYWNLPPEDIPQFNVIATATADASLIMVGDNKTFGRAVVRAQAGTEIQGYQSLDELYAGRPSAGPGRLAAFVITAAADEEFTWTARQGVAEDLTSPDPAAADPTPSIAAWEEVWASAFAEDRSYFSGSLPAITFDDPELDRLYYAGILALIHGRRTFRDLGPRARFATGGQAIWADGQSPMPVGYTTGATDGAPTTSFVWELHLSAPLLARLDPVVLRDQLMRFLIAGVERNWGIDLLTGTGVGMWYGINDGAILTVAAEYLAHTDDHAWLEVELAGRTVRRRLLDHVERHTELASGSDDHDLADYGAAHNVLECVSSYQHRIASFNALAAWSHRFAARVLEPDRAEAHQEAATRIERAVLGLFAGGPFNCRGPHGERVVRTCLDFIYVGRYLTEALDAAVRRAMIDFFVAELATPDWMRALSACDADSLTREQPTFQTYRADHQSTGAYGGWPGLAADVRFRFGDHDATIEWLRRISAVTWEGPFGQAYWVGLPDTPTLPARKASFFNGNCSMLVSGCTLSAALLTHLAPDA